MIDRKGFRTGVAMVIVNDKNRVFWARRVQQNNTWQFPQGGLLPNETPEQAMYRELNEEVGLKPKDVEIMTASREWLCYYLPRRLIRNHSKPICVGQKQMWYLLRFKGDETSVRFDMTDSPEFDAFRWVRYWFPLHRVIPFKRKVYRQALQEFAAVLFPNRANYIPPDDRWNR